jgi:hypothetical protein
LIFFAARIYDSIKSNWIDTEALLMRLLSVILFALLTNSATAADETIRIAESGSNAIEIPLDRIWSNAAANARSLRELEPELLVNRDTSANIEKYSSPEALKDARQKAKQSLVVQIEQALRELPLKPEKPLPGFAVAGIDRAALHGVYDVFVKGEKPKQSFPASAKITVVFFSRLSQPRVVVDRIERIDSLIRIHYMLISHGHLNLSSTLSLIPIGELPPGRYRVELIRSAKELQHNQRGFPLVEQNAESRIICAPFEFSVYTSAERTKMRD